VNGELKADILDLSRQNHIGKLTPWFDHRLDAEIIAGNMLTEEGIRNCAAFLVAGLVNYREHSGIDTVVLGMSSGVGSALTAALFEEAGWNVIGHTLPIEQNPDETARGIEACEALGIEHVQIDVSDQYRSMVMALGRHDQSLNEAQDQATNIRRGNIRARLRMITLYDQAQRRGGLVASTDNFSELAAGFWTLHGDVGDVAPIQSLLKSWEVPALSRLVGVPETTWRATPTDGLGISDGDEAQLGASYLEWDLTLLAITQALQEHPDLNLEDIQSAIGVSDDFHAQDVLQSVLKRTGKTWFKRAGTICLPHVSHGRYSALANLDAAFFVPRGL